MDDESFKDLARRALLLYRLSQKMQERMLDMFFNEFCELEQQEREHQIESAELPF